MARNLTGPRIREVRLKSKPPVTQAELAARLETKGVVLDRSAISRIEKQERQITDREIMAIAKALRVKPSDLMK